MGSSRPFLLAVALAVAAAPRAASLELDALADAPAALEASPVLQIAVVDLRELPREVLRAAWSQTAAVLERLGARLRERSAEPGDAQDAGDITVVLLPGRPAPHLKPTVLGVVQPAGAPRVLWLFPEVVAAALGLPAAPGSVWMPRDEALLAVGLGRVTAHELVHLLCPGRPHDRAGLMAERMSPSILRGGPFTVDDALRRDFQRGAGGYSEAARNRVAGVRSTPIL
jgi:hypothetical protein